jgi:hypothetical protein
MVELNIQTTDAGLTVGPHRDYQESPADIVHQQVSDYRVSASQVSISELQFLCIDRLTCNANKLSAKNLLCYHDVSV